MDEAVRAKLVEVLRLAYGGDVAKVVAHIRAFEAAPAGKRLPAESGRRVTCGEVVVDLIPSVAAPHGGNAVVQFEITVRAESGEAFGTVDCEAAFETMEKWHATKMELIEPTPNPAAFRAALLGMDAEAMRTATIG